MSAPIRSTLIFDGQTLPCVSSRFYCQTKSDVQGIPVMGSLDTNVRCWVDFHDSEQVQYSALQSLFTAGNQPTNDKIKAVTVEFWQDTSGQNAICSFKFQGWVSGVQMVNPVTSSSGQDNVGDDNTINHLLIVDIRPAMSNQDVSTLQMSN